MSDLAIVTTPAPVVLKSVTLKAQAAAIKKQIADAIEAEKLAKGPSNRGRGVMDAIYLSTMQHPTAKGDALMIHILRNIKTPDSNGRKTSKSAALTISSDFKHAARFLKSCTEAQRTAFFAAV